MEKIRSVVGWMKDHFRITLYSTILISLLTLALQFGGIIRGPINIIVSIIMALIGPIIYFIINSLIEEDKDKISAVRIFLSNCIFSMLLLINGILFTVFPLVDGKSWPLALAGVVDFFCFICLAFAINQPLTKANLESIKDINILGKLGIHLFAPQKKDGDVIICKNVNTNQNVIIPLKDRFLHMLVLGPTGSGKTSQIILPMLNQDLQNAEMGITVIEPKGDLAEKAYAMAQHYGRPAVYFNPISESCPTFNPLYGKEEDVIENMVTAFNMLNPDSQQYFKDMNEQLLRNALKVLKRLNGDKATLIDLSRLISNSMGVGRTMVMAFAKNSAKPGTPEALKKENDDVANYFLGDYFNEKSKTYENTSGVRSQVAKIVSNKFLRKVLNPENGISDINFDKHLEEGTVICISTAQGKLRDLGKYLGFFIILNFQSSVFKRPGRENDRRPHMLYIDEFQTYANPGFADMLTQGRSYRVASHLATQNRALIGMGSGKDGEDFIELVSTNARNVVLFPGGNYIDAKYYSDQFGEVTERKFQVGVSRTKFNPIYLEGGKAPSETERMSEELVPRYTPTDIILKKQKEITYSIMQSGVLKPAGVGKVEYIDKNLNEKLDKMIEENDIMMAIGLNPNKWRDLSNGAGLKRNLNWKKVLEDYEKLMLRERYDYNESDSEVVENNSIKDEPSKAPEIKFYDEPKPAKEPSSPSTVQINTPKSPFPDKVGIDGIVINPPKQESKNNNVISNDEDDDLL